MDRNLMILAAGISSRMKRSATGEASLSKKLVREANMQPKAMISVGEGGRPFLDYLLFNAAAARYEDVVLVLNEHDEVTEPYYRDRNVWGLKLSFARQTIPERRSKPLGTADAILQGLKSRSDWNGHKFTICNSDNLYSVFSLEALLKDDHQNSMIDYDRDALGVEPERVNAFAVICKDDEGFLTEIVEKPNVEQVEKARDDAGRIGVSMNIFRLDRDAILPELEACPLHPERHEKELPTAVKMMIEKYPRAVYTIPMADEVPDLTSKSDIVKVQQYLESMEIEEEGE